MNRPELISWNQLIKSSTQIVNFKWDRLDNSIREPLKNKLTERLNNPRVPTSTLTVMPECYKIKLLRVKYRLAYPLCQDSWRLKASREDLFDARQGELTANHRFVLDEIMRHIEEIEARIARFDARLLDELKSEHNKLALLQTLPAVDLIGAAMLLVEIGTDMDAFGSADDYRHGSASAPVTTNQPASANQDASAMPQGHFHEI